MTLKVLPKDKWEIHFSNGKLIVSAVSHTVDDGSVFRDYISFKLVDDATDYPVSLDDLEGVVLTVNKVHSVAGSGQDSELHARHLL